MSDAMGEMIKVDEQLLATASKLTGEQDHEKSSSRHCVN